MRPLMKPLYNGAMRLAQNRMSAEDLTQETYLRAYRTFDAFIPGTNARAWLFTILYSVFINRYHSERRQPVTMPPAEVEQTFADAESRAEVDLSRDRPAAAAIRAAVAALPDEFRAAVELVDLLDRSYEEAAAILHLKSGTLKSRLFRARKLLFTTLTSSASELGYPVSRTRGLE